MTMIHIRTMNGVEYIMTAIVYGNEKIKIEKGNKLLAETSNEIDGTTEGEIYEVVLVNRFGVWIKNDCNDIWLILFGTYNRLEA